MYFWNFHTLEKKILFSDFFKHQNRFLNFGKKYRDHVIFKGLILRNKNIYKKLKKIVINGFSPKSGPPKSWFYQTRMSNWLCYISKPILKRIKKFISMQYLVNWSILSKVFKEKTKKYFYGPWPKFWLFWYYFAHNFQPAGPN